MSVVEELTEYQYQSALVPESLRLVMQALGHENDSVEIVSITDDTCRIRVLWTARSCQQGCEYVLPLSVLCASNVIKATLTWDEEQRCTEAEFLILRLQNQLTAAKDRLKQFKCRLEELKKMPD